MDSEPEDTGTRFRLDSADVVVIILYLIATAVLAFWTICTGKGDLRNYFLAGRTMKWWPIGMSLFASNIGSNHFVGIAGTGAASGIAVIMFEWHAAFLLVLLGWIFLPVYISSGIYTMPEYLQRRFGGRRIRTYLSIVALLTYTFTSISADLYSGAVFIQTTMGWDLYVAVSFLLVIALVFTVLGGLQTVIVTDAFAVFVMIVGGLTLCGLGITRVGGLEALRYKYMRAVSNYTIDNQHNTTCGLPREDAWHIFRHVTKADYPSVATFLRTTIGSLWYWCASQVLVQRVLAAKNISHARGGALLAGYLKLLPFFLMVLPGMTSRVLFPNEVACSDPVTCQRVCGSSVGCTNIAYPRLAVELLPTGLRGLLLAAMIAAVISTLTSFFNSSSSLFTLDLWSLIRPRASNTELVIVGRLFVIVLTGVSIAWIPVMADAKGGEIFKYATSVAGYLGAPTCAMFVLAVFWPRANEQGAFWGMLIAQLWGITRFVLDFVYPAPSCHARVDNRPSFIRNFHEYYHTFSEIVLAFLVAIVISLFTKPIPRHELAGLTFWSRYEKPLKDVLKEEAKLKRAHRALQQEESTTTPSCNKISLNQRDASDLLRMEISSSTSSSSEEGGSKVWQAIKERVRIALLGSPATQPLRSDDDDNYNESVNLKDEEDYDNRMASLKQSHSMKLFLNINAVIIFAVTVFLLGFWS